MAQLSYQINGPVAVIGDVHGQVDEVDSILNQLRQLPDYENRWIVFIGDLVDRGPNPKKAVDQLIALRKAHPKTTCVMGNHELAMGFATGLFDAPEYTDWSERWCEFYGAEQTFASYGAEFPFCDDLREKMPVEHVELLQSLPWAVDHPDFFFVHAGLDPNQSFDIQRRILEARDFSLSRPPWLCSKDFANEAVPPDCDKVVVSGHVPVPEVQAWRQRILIDTTGGLGGELSCVLLPEFSVVGSAPVAAVQPSPEVAARTTPRNRSTANANAASTVHRERRTEERTRRRAPEPAPQQSSPGVEGYEVDDDYRPRWYEFWK